MAMSVQQGDLPQEENTMKRLFAGTLALVMTCGVLFSGCGKQMTPEEEAASQEAAISQQLQDEENKTGLKRLISNNLTEYEQPVHDFIEGLQDGDAEKTAMALGVPNTFGEKLQDWVVVNDFETFQKTDMTNICLNSAKEGSKAVINVYHMVWPEEHILLMAPTGLAAKRMAESTGMNSSTIHKACGLVPANNPSGFTAQGDCTICGFIGIDEMSMVGEHLFAYAIDAVLSSPSTRIVLLGDTDQLAPVARGDVLRDLIKCGVIKTVRLDVNYRQGSTSTITDASIKIRENRAYTGNTRNLMFDDEFRFVPVAEKDKEKEANEIMNHIVDEYLNGVSKYGMEGTIVLTPTHYDKGTPSGYLCKNRVNAAIQAIVNPKTDDKLCVEIGKQLFMVGDRIIQRKNTEQVINGDLGTIQSIAQLESDVAVEIYFDSKGETLVYNNEDMKDIELAYAITVHSSQGCEFPCCIIPVSMTYGVMLTKPLYYTGITRAKKKLVMIGDEEALKYALQNFRKQTRKSLLGPRIITKLKKAKT